MRSEEFDYQQSNITLLKAQLKLVTHERDMLKKDVKRISQERDGAYRHMSLSASPQSSLETSSHHRTNSDTAPTIAKSGNCYFAWKPAHICHAKVENAKCFVSLWVCSKKKLCSCFLYFLPMPTPSQLFMTACSSWKKYVYENEERKIIDLFLGQQVAAICCPELKNLLLN